MSDEPHILTIQPRIVLEQEEIVREMSAHVLVEEVIKRTEVHVRKLQRKLKENPKPTKAARDHVARHEKRLKYLKDNQFDIACAMDMY